MFRRLLFNRFVEQRIQWTLALEAVQASLGINKERAHLCVLPDPMITPNLQDLPLDLEQRAFRGCGGPRRQAGIEPFLVRGQTKDRA
jgi:hypothetical protein